MTDSNTPKRLGPVYPMRCKYDETHGTFSNGRRLREHYDEAHGWAGKPTKREAKEMRARSAAAAPPPVPVEQGRYTCRFNPEHGSFNQPQAIARHYAIEHANEYTPKASAAVVPIDDETSAAPRPKVRRAMLPSVDDVVLPAVLAIQNGHSMTEDQLAAVFAWRDATRIMLDTFRP